MAVEYLTTERVSQIMGMTARQARKLMHEIGMVKVGHGMIRRDALDRYLQDHTECTYYTRPLLEQPVKPKYDRYARSAKARKEA